VRVFSSLLVSRLRSGNTAEEAASHGPVDAVRDVVWSGHDGDAIDAFVGSVSRLENAGATADGGRELEASRNEPGENRNGRREY
jgi:hypothetical protein